MAIHLFTLGWISASILRASYIVAPLALGMPFRASWIERGALGVRLRVPDWWAFWRRWLSGRKAG